ncbi:MAG: molybdenum cofactor biosynthesis protein MoaB [Planctomycetia bacterium]|jgi:molybdenum cofactor biosynthesis protein B|nr:molybdenum cofactor biosynthesis protein MoaB [Planctomycetia bacterium]
MTATHQQHEAQGPTAVRCAVITVSDSRTLETDAGGRSVIDHLKAAGHAIVCREIVPDEPSRMKPLLVSLRDRDDVDVIVMTGGTGITSRDQTYETVNELLDKPLPGYGEIFRMLSYQDIGPAAILSRAVGGLMGRKVLLTMPGSPAAVRLAMEKIIVPQIPHLVREARR